MNDLKQRRVWRLSFIGLLALALLLRLALPELVKFTLNRKLGTGGNVGGIGLSLWRGAYQIQDLQFLSTDHSGSEPVVTVSTIDIGINWPAFRRGKLLATVRFVDPVVNLFTQGKGEQGVLRVDRDWTGPVMGLIPFQIDRLEARHGQVHFRDPGSSPDLDLALTDLDLNADHLSDRERSDGGFTSSVTATGKVMNSGKFECYARITPLAKNPTFESSTKVAGLELKELNPLFLRYFGLGVSEGKLTVDGKWSAGAGKYKGYVQPVIMGLKLNKPREDTGFGRSLKRVAAGIVGWYFQKPENSWTVKKLNYEGVFSDPSINVWQATIFLYADTFLQALPKKTLK